MIYTFLFQEVNESPEILKYIWYPELEIYGLDTFGRQRVLKEMSGVRLNKNKTITYELGVRITISCRMDFNNYPLDAQTCQFQVGSCEFLNILNNEIVAKVMRKTHLIYSVGAFHSN